MRGHLRPAVPAYGAIAIKTAEQHAPALRAGAAQYRQNPTEIARVTHRALERDKEPLELGEVIALIALHIGDVDIAGRPCVRVDIGGLSAIVAGRHRTVEAAPRPPGEGDEPFVALGQRA